MAAAICAHENGVKDILVLGENKTGYGQFGKSAPLHAEKLGDDDEVSALGVGDDPVSEDQVPDSAEVGSVQSGNGGDIEIPLMCHGGEGADLIVGDPPIL